MNILYIGSSGALSLVPFKKLLSSQHKIIAVGIFKPVLMGEKVIALHNESLALAANQYDLPLLDLSQPLKSILDKLTNLLIDIVLVSCYGRRLPNEIRSFGKLGCFNLHPSLLPRYRGPEPIFWQMKAGDALGISWHYVVHEFDAGNLVAQKRLIADDGASYAEINQQLAVSGADLMIDLLMDLSDGKTLSMPQNPDIASYFPYPKKKDFVVDTKWSAQRAYNFMRATEKFGFLYRCQIGDYSYILKHALDYDNNIILQYLEVQADRLYIPCTEGVLITTFTDRIVL